MDSNSKLGPDIIANDPHSQSENGKILWDIICRNGLIVVNGMLEKCKGSITRRRETVNGVEQSIIDHVIVSHGLKEDIESLDIDECGNKAITNLGNRNFLGNRSDHNVLLTTFNLKW